MITKKIFVLVFLFYFGCRHGASKPTVKPLVDMRTCDIIDYYDYPCEKHRVQTKDGYILEVHRIPHSGRTNNTGKGVAFLQHGLIDSSFTWVANPPNHSLAYILSDDGYDVWMGNCRGNTYSSQHVILKDDDDKFWDFSVDEFAKYDLPAMIDYALETTGERQLHYIGHSQGTAIGFAGFSTIPSLARKIKIFFALAPITHIAHMKGLMGVLSTGSFLAKRILSLLGTKNFAPTSWIVKELSDLICRGPIKWICKNVMTLICGTDTHNFIQDRIQIYLGHTPAGTSAKDILHFSQWTQSNKFNMFDYGWNGNMHKYLQPFPPEYDLTQVNVPVALYVGEDDWLSTEEDVTSHLRVQLPDMLYDVDIPDWNHMDFVWGRQAKDILYSSVLKMMNGEILKSPRPLRNKTMNG